jgi:hypothetical protein
MQHAISVDSISQASDLGYRALADLAAAAEGLDYRVVGGHMVQLLMYVYPCELAVRRGTSDADAGIDGLTAAGLELHHQLLARDYRATAGSHYVKGDDEELIEVDLLVPRTLNQRTEELGGRVFDAIPGLALALNQDPIDLSVLVRLLAGDELQFSVPIPGIEVALMMKALAMQTRSAKKDLTDLCSLLEMAHLHRASLNWKLDNPEAVAKGHRRDGARALYQIVDEVERGTIPDVPPRTPPARMAALIKRHVAAPPK